MSTHGTVIQFPHNNTLEMTMDILSQIHMLKPKKGDHGFLVCPKCGGQFHWSYNGPRAQRGACATPKCLSFIS